MLYRARTSDCDPCPLKPKCCPKAPERKIPRSIYKGARDAARLLVVNDPDVWSSYSGRREPARDLGPSMLEGGCSHEQPEVRASHDLRADLMPLAANKISGGQQLSGSNNLVVAGSEQENWASYYREINRASECCETASCKLIV